jgi:hypothetical protein
MNVSEIFYISAIISLKLSLGIFFLQIVQNPTQRSIIYTAMIVNTIFGVAMVFFAIFQCGIYKSGLDFVIKRLNDKCVSDASALGMTYTHATITMLTDWVFLLMPFWALKGSLMSFKEKLTIGFILAFASLSGIASIIRFPYIHRLSGPNLNFLGKFGY